MFAIVRMPFVEDRFFNWAPHDSRTDYSITATHAGQAVTDSDILRRYNLPPIEWHSAGNLQKVIDVAERRKAVQDQWSVRLLYRVNFGPEQVWEYKAAVTAE